jgi:cytoskeletal protein CcmA (bactofilin family)
MSTFGLFVPEGNEQKGELHVEGGARIEGSFTGAINCEETFTLGPNGVYAGSVECLDAHIMGSFRGTLRVYNECTIYKTAQFQGLLDSSIVQVDKGSQVQGEVFISGGQSS